MADTFDLADLLSKQTQYQAAKSGSGGLLDMVLAGYQAAFPKAPAANLLMGARQAYNVGKYNKAVQAEAMRQQLRQQLEDTNNASIYQKRTGVQMQGPFDIGLANSSAPDIRKDNATPSINDALAGKQLQLDNNADYSPELINQWLAQQGKATNFAGRNGGLGAIGEGQNASLLRLPPSAMNLPKPGQPAPPTPSGGALTAGASFEQMPPQIPTNVSPYMLPTDIPSQVADLFKAGLTDAHSKATTDETGRHNKTTEGETGRHNRANEGIGYKNAAAHMLSASKAGSSGRAPTLLDLMSPTQRAQYLERQATGETAKAPKITSTDIKTMGELRQAYNSEAGGFFKNPEKAAQAAADYNVLADQFNMPKLAPFGNTSNAKIKNAGQTVGSKYGVKY